MQQVSEKELNYIKDLLSWELLSAKKSFQYSNQEQDPAQQQVFRRCTQIHQQNYTNILNYVQDINQMQGGGRSN